MELKKTRRRPGQSVCFVGFLATTALLSATPADAYLDPMSGSYVIQILLAMVVSVGVAVRHYWTRLASFWSRLNSGEAPEKPASKDPSTGSN